MYIEKMEQKKNESPSLASIIYPVYDVKHMQGNLKSTPCHIVVEDSRVRQDELTDYFNKTHMIEGKFSRTFINQDAKKLLEDNGYNIADNCILIEKGSTPWSLTTCIIVITLCLMLTAILVLSIFPESLLRKLFKQDTLVQVQ